jgi:hypothetical protein
MHAQYAAKCIIRICQAEAERWWVCEGGGGAYVVELHGKAGAPEQVNSPDSLWDVFYGVSHHKNEMESGNQPLLLNREECLSTSG